MKAMRWSELLFDSDDEEMLKKNIIKNNPAKELRVLLEYNHRQLGYTDEWLRDKISEAMSKGENAGADFLNIWAKGSDVSPLPKDVIALIQKSQAAIKYTTISKSGYLINWYIHEEEVLNLLHKRKIIIGLDTSDAVSKDDIAMYLRDSNSGETLATGLYNETNLVIFSEFIVDLLVKYLNSTLIIERRSSGVMIIDNLLKILPLKGIDPFKRIFNWVVNDCNINKMFMSEVVSQPMSRRDNIVYTKYRQYFGFATSGSGRQSRDGLYGATFMAATKYTGGSIKDNTLINQIIGLRSKNNRIDHGSGGHDDLVIAWLLTYWFLIEANNKSFYGLSPNEILTTVKLAKIDEAGGKEEIEKRERQIELKYNIERLGKELKNSRNPTISLMLKNKINSLYKLLEPTSIDTLNIDTFLQNMEIERRRDAA